MELPRTDYKLHKNRNTGFTLLEMLLVIAIIAILASIVIIAINPGRQLAQARNSQRTSDLATLDKAIKQFFIDFKYWPASTTVTASFQEVCDSNDLPSGCLDLGELVPDYISAIPNDPGDDSTGSNYYLAIPSNNEPEWAAASSTEFSLDAIVIGTTTAVVATGTAPGADNTVANLRNGLVAYFPFDSDFTDNSSTGNDATGTNTDGDEIVAGKVGGGGLQLDGGEKLETAASAAYDITTNLTFAYWVNRSSGSSPYSVFRKMQSANGNHTYGANYSFSGGTVQNFLNYSTGGDGDIYNTTHALGSWYYVVVRYDGSVATTTVNANSGTAYSAKSGALVSSTGVLRIGANQIGTGGEFFPGQIDELAIWNRVLTDEEIDTLYASGSGFSIVQ